MEFLMSLKGLSPEFIKIASVTWEVWTLGSPEAQIDKPQNSEILNRIKRQNKLKPHWSTSKIKLHKLNEPLSMQNSSSFTVFPCKLALNGPSKTGNYRM